MNVVSFLDASLNFICQNPCLASSLEKYLAPRKLRGVESQGMILMAENEKGELGFVSPEREWSNGFGVR